MPRILRTMPSTFTPKARSTAIGGTSRCMGAGARSGPRGRTDPTARGSTAPATRCGGWVCPAIATSTTGTSGNGPRPDLRLNRRFAARPTVLAVRSRRGRTCPTTRSPCGTAAAARWTMRSPTMPAGSARSRTPATARENTIPSGSSTPPPDSVWAPTTPSSKSPVRAGLCTRAAAYSWSSAAARMTGWCRPSRCRGWCRTGRRCSRGMMRRNRPRFYFVSRGDTRRTAGRWAARPS